MLGSRTGEMLMRVKTTSQNFKRVLTLSPMLQAIGNRLEPNKRVIDTRKKPGERGSPKRKLTNEQVREIRAKYKPYYYTAKMLAREYDVHVITIEQIVQGFTRPFA